MAGNGLQTLSEIFNDKLFRIPDYQRGYSWEQEQLEDFWRDIDNLDDKRTHYTGMITVEHKQDTNHYHIIDGQQRLTTIMILLKVILDKFNDEDWFGNDEFGKNKSDLIKQFLYKKSGRDGHKINPIFGYDKDNPSDIYYRTRILSLENTENYNISIDTLYTKNLNSAKEFFENKIKNLENNNLEVIVRKITQKLKFNFYEIDKNDGLDEYIIFETMNNRGKSLTTLELLKNRLIYLTTLLNNDKDEIEELRHNINETWKTIYSFLGKKSEEKIEDDIFLKDHYRMYFGHYDRTIANPEREFLLKRYFTIQRVTFRNTDRYQEIINIPNEFNLTQHQIRDKYLTYSDIKNYIFNIQKAVKAYYGMLNPLESDYSKEIKKWLSKINRLRFDTFKPLLMAILIRYDILEEHHIIKILKLIENYMFIMFRTRKRSNTTIRDFFELAYRFHVENFDIYQVIERLDDRIFNNHQNNLFKLKKFIEIIQDNFDDENKKGWYSWNGLKYLLYEYELFLQENMRGETKLQWEEINKDSIEHIYPQNTVRECWRDFNNLDEQNKRNMLHSLGNLVLLSQAYNAQLGNQCFDNKREIFSSASYSTIEISKEDHWTREVILKRGYKILEFMSDRWQINLSKEDIERLIFR